MATVRRPILAADEWCSKKSDDRPADSGVTAERSLWRSIRQVRRRRVVFALLAVWVLYLFVRNIPTTLPPVSRRYDQYGAQRPTAPQPPNMEGPSRPPADSGPPTQDYEGPIILYKLPATLSGFNHHLSGQGIVLFAFSSLKSASPLVSAACAMAGQKRASVHVAVMGRHEVDSHSLLALNGIAEADCPIIWHDAQPDFAPESTEARMTASVESALGYLHYSLSMQVLLFDNSKREDDFFRAAITARAPLMGIPAIGVPDRDAWMLALDAPALRQWNEVSIEIVIRARPESSASLIRLLKSIQKADYSALSYPKLTIELPATVNQGLSDYIASYQWPPGAPASKRTLTLRRRLNAPAQGLGAATVSTLESFYPTSVQTHVLVLSPDVELSANYYHLLLYLILDAKYSARSSSVSDQLLGISLESESFAPAKSNADHTTWAFTQAPSGDAALYFGDKWIQIHKYVGLRMQADPEWRKSVDAQPDQPANSPAWMRATTELMQAMSYFMLQPVFTTASSPLVTVHTELHSDPPASSTADENAPLLTEDEPVFEEKDGHLLLRATEPRSAREYPMLSASSVLSLLGDNSNQRWAPEMMQLFDAHGLTATWDQITEQRSSYAAQLTRSVGGCTSANIDITSLDADSMSVLFLPNKHLPFCPPGPIPSTSQRITPPNSPPARAAASAKPHSLLHPPHHFPKLLNTPPIYGIDAKTLSDVLHHNAAQPLPPPSSVFPWLHGLHPNNHIQLAFFVSRRKSLRRVPKQIRAITIIKAGGDLSCARIKGAVAPDEVLSLSDDTGPGFLDCDPSTGFSVRNFHIQTAKVAQVSDLIVYGDAKTDHRIIKSVAERASLVQRRWKKELDSIGQGSETFHTFVLTEPFEDFEHAHPEHVAVNSTGHPTSDVVDFLQQERREMHAMSRPSEISRGVYLGCTPDLLNPSASGTVTDGDDHNSFDLYVDANDQASMPDDSMLAAIARQLDNPDRDSPVYMCFPSSGSVMPSIWCQPEADDMLRICRWLYTLTHPTRRKSVDESTTDQDADIYMTELSPSAKPWPRILIHCADGYTETSLLGIAYFIYSEGWPLHEAWIRLHRDRARNFFAYANDVALLLAIQDHLLADSPAFAARNLPSYEPPDWITKFDGSLPSRILPFMYLGNLSHANNPQLLRLLGIKRILSVGEPVQWSKADLDAWGKENLMMVDRVQDNGIDELTAEMDRCLNFIGQGKSDDSATLVHCRVGVSRSATICIAEVMANMNLSFPKAYCFVRARRLNVIIQPHLRFVYELMKWDELQQEKRGQPLRREMDWASVSREIAAMNRPEIMSNTRLFKSGFCHGYISGEQLMAKYRLVEPWLIPLILHG
ncbi:hypothetical protein DV736_g4402, partial [Chaetothyriales sp. CBS 134916]